MNTLHDDIATVKQIGRSTPNLACRVCGDRSSGKHYGVQSCDGCRGFFKRSVRRKLTYICREKGSCPIDVARRNQCQHCRLRRCFESGMNKDAVQHERTPRSVKQSKGYSMVFNVFNKQQHKRRHSEVGQLEEGAKDVPKIPKKENESPPSSDGHQTDTPAMSPRHLQPVSMKEVVYESSMRILYVSIHWVKHIPTFTELSPHDQGLLLQHSWGDVFILSLLQWNLPVDIDVWLTSVACQTSASGNGKHLMEIHDLQNIVTKFRVIMPDAVELSCAKAITLFKPELKGLHDPWHVEQLQDQAQCMLGEHVRQQCPEQYVRFGKLLLLVPQLAKIQTPLLEQVFFQTTGQTQTVEKLVKDIFNCS